VGRQVCTNNHQLWLTCRWDGFETGAGRVLAPKNAYRKKKVEPKIHLNTLKLPKLEKNKLETLG
jgi:hypothetical protein